MTAPTAAAFFYGGASITVHSVAIGAMIWVGAAGMLHGLAQIMLGGLRP